MLTVIYILALYTLITFPFLFAIMFGDAGHGIILLAFAISLICIEKKYENKKSNNEVFNIFFGGRYIILLMGIFSIYTGIIYNDVFCKPIKIFASGWFVNYNSSTVLTNTGLQLNPDENFHEYPYPLGVDPVWQVSQKYKNFIDFEIICIIHFFYFRWPIIK